ncbi:MAG: hypothetical protein COB41_00635 [Proteobacteria bacterium]|nr:MAG: hypothetical protein COB41_00020 [Pseudomonadota bacterium]PCI45929.1 MAG: hypothetical protein COB41_00635 [Pseudomonadota bacterium]
MKKDQSYLSTIQWYNLYYALEAVNKIFYKKHYLVGSAMTRKDFRDVDIRTVMPEEGLLDSEFARKSMSMWISEWLSSRTQMTIDYQIQTQKEFNNESGPSMVIGESI